MIGNLQLQPFISQTQPVHLKLTAGSPDYRCEALAASSGKGFHVRMLLGNGFKFPLGYVTANG